MSDRYMIPPFGARGRVCVNITHFQKALIWNLSKTLCHFREGENQRNIQRQLLSFHWVLSNISKILSVFYIDIKCKSNWPLFRLNILLFSGLHLNIQLYISVPGVISWKCTCYWPDIYDALTWVLGSQVNQAMHRKHVNTHTYVYVLYL